MTEIPEHLLKRAAMAKEKREMSKDFRPPPTLSGLRSLEVAAQARETPSVELLNQKLDEVIKLLGGLQETLNDTKVMAAKNPAKKWKFTMFGGRA